MPLICSAVNNLPMGYPVIQQPPVPAAGQHHFDSTGYTTSSCPIVNGVPAPGNFHPVRMMSGNECEFFFLKPTFPLFLYKKYLIHREISES